jgi:anti-anti-sigma factor
MSEPPAELTIHESRSGLAVRLSLSGELDLGSAPLLEDRLARLRVAKSSVRLDLSRLEFIDSTGLHLLVRTVGDAQIKGWDLEIEPDVAPDVMRLFKLVHLDRFVQGSRLTDGGKPKARR